MTECWEQFRYPEKPLIKDALKMISYDLEAAMDASNEEIICRAMIMEAMIRVDMLLKVLSDAWV